MRSILSFLLLGFSLATANAQTSTGTERLTPGTYTGRAQEGAKSAEADLVVKHITADGRITATLRPHHPGPMCGKSMPASGFQSKDGTVRLEVDAGAPEGCARTYVLRLEPDGKLAGTSVYRGKTYALQLERK